MLKEFKELLKREVEQRSGDLNEQELKDALARIDNQSSLYGLGYSFKEAVIKLKKAGFTIRLTQEELENDIKELRIAEKSDSLGKEKNGLVNGWINVDTFESTQDIVTVHKTNYAPEGDKIDSRHSGNVLEECNVTIGGEDYTFFCKSGRNTVHLSANHEVSPNNGGDWGKMRYAVIVPYEDLNEYSKIKSINPVDLYAEGAVKLTENCYILCPNGESEKIQADNPNVTVIEYEGERVQDYANMLIANLGYKVAEGHDHDFEAEENTKAYEKVMKAEGHRWVEHSNSEDKKKETALGDIYESVGVIKLIKDERILDKVDRAQVKEDLEKARVLWKWETSFNMQNKYSEVFIEELRKEGIEISFEELRKVAESHMDENRRLDMSPYELTINYMFDAISRAVSKESKHPITIEKIGEITNNVPKGIIDQVARVENVARGEEKEGEEPGDN